MRRLKGLFARESSRTASAAARAHVSAEDGNAIAEIALTMPIIGMILTGMFTLSITLYQKLQVTEAAAVGARFLATDRGDTDPCNATANKFYAAAPGLTRSSLNFTFVLNGVSTSGTSCPGPSGGANANMVSGGTAQLQVTYPCVLKAWKWTASSCTLGAQITEIVQ